MCILANNKKKTLIPSSVYKKSKIIQNQPFFGQERPDSDNIWKVCITFQDRGPEPVATSSNSLTFNIESTLKCGSTLAFCFTLLTYLYFFCSPWHFNLKTEHLNMIVCSFSSKSKIGKILRAKIFLFAVQTNSRKVLIQVVGLIPTRPSETLQSMKGHRTITRGWLVRNWLDRVLRIWQLDTMGVSNWNFWSVKKLLNYFF